MALIAKVAEAAVGQNTFAWTLNVIGRKTCEQGAEANLAPQLILDRPTRSQCLTRIGNDQRVQRSARPLLQRLDPVGEKRQAGRRLDHETHYRRYCILLIDRVQITAIVVVEVLLADRLQTKTAGQQNAIIPETHGVGHKRA